MRDNSAPRSICAACTSRYATRTVWQSGTCDHDSSHRFDPATRAETDVPAESLDRSPRVGLVELCHLFELGRELYGKLTARESWRLSRFQQVYALDAVLEPHGGATFGPVLSPIKPETGYAVTIRPRGAVPAFVPLGTGKSLDKLVAEFSTSAPYIGVFRNEITKTVDVDPVAVVETRREADALGVYCRSLGGAYNFADGLGYWAPCL